MNELTNLFLISIYIIIVGFRSSVVNVLDYGAHGHGFKPVVGVFGELSFSSLSSVRRRGVDFKLCLRINIRYNAV